MSTVQPSELNDVFRANLIRLRTDLGLSQSQLAERLSGERKVYAPYICDIEKGVKMPGLAMLAKLAEVLGVQPKDLLDPNRKKSLIAS